MPDRTEIVPVRLHATTVSPLVSDAPASTSDYANLFHLLLSKSWIIVLFVVLSLLAAVVYLIRTPKIYASRATIQVEEEAPKVLKIEEINSEDFRSPEVLKTIEQSLMSDTLVLRVIRANGLDKNPSFAPPRKDGSAYLDSELVDRFKAKLSVELRRNTRLIDIIVEDTDPKRAQQLAQSMVKEFLDQSIEQRYDVAKAASDFLVQEAERLKEKLHKSEQAVQDYRERYHTVSLEEKQNIIVEKLKELNQKVTEAKAERLKLEADAEAIRQGRATTPEELLTLASVAALPEVQDLRRQLANRQSVYKTSVQTRGLKQTLNRALLNAGDQVMKSYEVAKAKEANLVAALNEQEQAALELNRIAVPYNVLVREVESDRALYESVLTRMKETGVAKGIGENSIRLIESPLVSAHPIRPAKLRILVLALLGGAITGTGLVWGIGMADSSIRTIDEAERISGLPVLTMVPESKRKDLRTEPVLMTGPATHEAEAFRTLRTALSFFGQEKELKTILFTSANPAEGKTYCSLNYAVAAAQLGLRTLLVDADLRRASLSKVVLANTDEPGLTACLAGRAAIDGCCTATGIENLWFLGAGERASKPAELLASGELARLLEEAALHFDRIVLDSAPVNSVSDAQVIAKNVQAVCLIVRAGKTPRRAVLRACSRLARATHKPGGIILNRMARGSRDSYYSSYYAGGYTKAVPSGRLTYRS
ncbi:MAG: polysaccharide biosynthesis tyrosine autokinase [Verrucomicrobia bacterium]|nr:polysaccharide biosynthesis tyrosine autokinase [Verrucomicrobiota bacterium]